MLYLNRGEFVGVGRSPPPPRDGGHPRYCPAFNTVVFEILDVDNPPRRVKYHVPVYDCAAVSCRKSIFLLHENKVQS